MLIALVVVLGVVLSMRRARRATRVTHIERTVVRKKENGTGA
jgi:hypothetical protein